METKSVAVELKAQGDDAGHVSAVFSTLNVRDHDGDVTLPGAFQDGQKVRMQLSHDIYNYSIGKGTIRTAGEQVIFDGQINLKTDLGRNVYEALRFDMADGQPLQEWSYYYDVLDSSYGVFDGEDTRFLKSLKVYEVSPVFLGAGRGTTTLAVKSRPFSDEADAALAAVKALIARSGELASLRAKEGRTLSSTNRDRLASLLTALQEAQADLEKLLSETEPKADPKLALHAYADFLQTQMKLRSMQI